VQVGYHCAKKDVENFFTFEVDLFEAHEEELDQFGCFEDDL
jgi:hypothetical protein